MAFLRRRLSVVTAAWLVCQLAVLTAIIPADCCAGHRAPGRHCDDATASDAQCPMRGTHGQPCPMHRASATQHHGGHHGGSDAEPAAAPCRMYGTCAGPLAAFVALLSNHATLPAVSMALFVPDPAERVRTTDEQFVRQLDPPPLPPARNR